MPSPGQVDDEADQHPDACGAEAPMPPDFLAQRADDERRDQRTDVEREQIQAERARPPIILGIVEQADLRRHIAQHAARPGDDQHQRDQEQMLDRHRQMSGGHQQRADRHGRRFAEHAVAEPGAEQRGCVDQPRIQAIGLRGEGKIGHRPEHRGQRGAVCTEAEHAARMLGQQQIFGHVQHQQRLHAVERKPLPQLGPGQDAQPLGMAEQGGTGDVGFHRRRPFVRQRHRMWRTSVGTPSKRVHRISSNSPPNASCSERYNTVEATVALATEIVP